MKLTSPRLAIALAASALCATPSVAQEATATPGAAPAPAAAPASTAVPAQEAAPAAAAAPAATLTAVAPAPADTATAASSAPACELHVFPTTEGQAMTTGWLSGFG